MHAGTIPAGYVSLFRRRYVPGRRRVAWGLGMQGRAGAAMAAQERAEAGPAGGGPGRGP
jgi:hypothetical protein